MRSEGPIPGIDTRRVRSLDGAEIAYRVTISPDHDAPWLVLANGLGGTWLAWRGVIDYLADRFRLLTWDYRGLYDSGRPTPDTDAAYGVERHVADLEAILAAEGVTRATFVGWSLGAQVVLEKYRRAPAAVSSLVLVAGTYGRPHDTLIPLPGAARVLPGALDFLRRGHGVAGSVLRFAHGHVDLVPWARRLGVCGRAHDDALFRELADGIARLDLEPYFRILKTAGLHDAEPLLSQIDVPVLLVAGTRDRFAPRELAHQMARRIPEAEVLMIHGGTHFLPVEYPELLGLRIERFVRERVLRDHVGAPLQ